MGSLNFETDKRTVDVVVWDGSEHTSDRYGKQQIGSAADTKVRWEEGNTLSFDPAATEEPIVATLIAGSDYPIGTIFWKGTVATLPADLDTLIDFYRVVGKKTIPDIKGWKTRYQLVVGAHNDMLPQIYS